MTDISPDTFSEHTGIRDSIDPEVVRDPETGRVWLFFGCTGKMQRVELDDAGAQVRDSIGTTPTKWSSAAVAPLTGNSWTGADAR